MLTSTKSYARACTRDGDVAVAKVFGRGRVTSHVDFGGGAHRIYLLAYICYGGGTQC